MNDEFFMKEALNEAKLAASEEEVPIGAVIVYKNKIIARGHNYTVKGKSALKHAEIIAIYEASKFIGDFRLNGCTMYVTMEPCSMCAGAIVNSRIDRVVIALPDYKRGACGSHIDLTNDKDQLWKSEVEMGLFKEESLEIVQNFFKLLRKKNKEKKQKK
ncbi:MAG: nucleoside deaminase [Peptoniphilaceae bacterium]|nr:nucleoside deaminase [Peptoniphilaceae bacterium]MDD7383559.1 nucleoside deaminase [Peptoniphilaceae bacterium]MDY3738732.1 nucleoside deaminase [Peptoniphilaceae bacterium]